MKFRCLILLVPLATAQIRFCEVSGSCRQCPDKRYTYYRCNSQRDCLNGETCTEGFCCPNIQNQPPMMTQFNETFIATTTSSATIHLYKPDPFPLPPLFLKDNSIIAQSNDVDEKCGDGSDWVNRCKKDSDCNGLLICMDGKCCRSCSQRRREILDKLAATEILGRAIPQCTEDGKYYRNKQCFAGSIENCWCVNGSGKRLLPSDIECQTKIRRKEHNWARKAQLLRDELTKKQKDNCTLVRRGSCPRIRAAASIPPILCNCDEDCYGNKKCCEYEANRVCIEPVASNDDITLLCASNEQFSACHSPCQPTCEDPTVLPCPSPTCQAGCHCQPGFIRRDGSPHSPCIAKSSCVMYDVTAQCSDQRREYQGCGSSCPISCQNRNSPRCHERCVSGCFCRVPYILENSEDPLNSRCILASECTPATPVVATVQHNMRDSYSQFPIVPAQNAFNPYSQYYPTPGSTATVIPNTNRCADSLKNYLSCGTKCPVGCNALSPSVSCTLQCVPGCFCHAPYILLDSNDPQSACVLPQNCPSKESSPKTCPDPRKEYSTCGAASCARSCSNLLGRCESGHCSSGCICREPYVLQDSNDVNSRCVLPSECERKCDDPMKEFVTCGSSCPMACDNRHPKSCTPCQTGCYCKNGLVFKNSTNWQNSICVRLEDCPPIKEELIPETTPITTTTTTTSTTTPRTIETETTTFEETTTSSFLTTTQTLTGLMIEKTLAITPPIIGTNGLSSSCPVTTLDVGGRSCNSDDDCPVQQHCCRALIASLGVNPQRCSCSDPLAVWSACGSLCPEYCGQPSIPVCSSTCNPGCQCAPGYIRARNDVAAPCIPREACESAKEAFQLNDTPRAIMKEIPSLVSPTPKVTHRLVASATLEGQILSGRLTFNKDENGQLNIEGKLDGLAPGRHALILHKFGDATRDCSRIGPPHLIGGSLDPPNPAIIDIEGSHGGLSEFSSNVNWPAEEVIGRSVAIYGISLDEWLRRPLEERPLACGTVGFTYV